MNKELITMLKHLRLKGLLENWDRYFDTAKKRNFSHVKLLKYIIEEEFKIKCENSRKLRLARSKIPEKYVIETFPFKKQPKLNKKNVLQMYDSLDYMSKNQNVIFIGPTGVGKTGLATAFLTNAIDQNYKGRFISFPELVEMFYKSVADHSEVSVMKNFVSYDCLLIDELGYVEVEPIQVGLFFTMMKKRHRKKTTLITSNLGFSQWNSFLKNDNLTAALIDRLTEKSHIINMKNCCSLRKKLNQV
ncbi:MAG: ATP-binding protein [archaeon]|nr:ATP-binding protein [archaeon]